MSYAKLKRRKEKTMIKGSKKTVWVFVALLLFGTALFPLSVQATYPPEVWAEFPNTTTSSIDEYDLLDTFIVEFRVDSNDVRGNIWSWQTGGCYYDNSILEAISVPLMTPADPDYIFSGKVVGTWRAATIEHPLGRVKYAGQSLSAPETDGVVDSDALLTWIEFKVIGYGSCNIDIVSSPPDLNVGTKLNNKTGASIIPIEGVVLTDGYFSNTGLKPPPYSPTAVIRQDTPPPYYVGDLVDLSAEDSTAGFDGENPCPVTEWTWNIDGVNVSTTETYSWDTGSYAAGPHTVILYVKAPNGTGGDPTYNPWDTDTEIKTLYEVPTGRNLDLYTQDYRAHGYSPVPDGRGPGLPAEEFQPQELVWLFANVTYNGDVVQHKLVAFEVRDPWNQCVTYRTEFSNETGVAAISFRIPWPCEGSENATFGTWFAYASVDIAKEKADDNLTFTVHYIVEILSIITTAEDGTPLSEFKKCDYIFFNITVMNWAMTSRYATITVVVYDELGVPIGQIVIADWLFPSGTSSDIVGSIHVPKWAYIGVGAAYANAYTLLPMFCGVPWCPEADCILAIVLP